MDVKPNLKTIEEIFYPRIQYYVPKFQRSFSWDADKVQQLWEDIKDVFYDQKSNTYFLGFVLVKHSKNTSEYLEVIDGQQRLATLTILFACLRDILLDLLEAEERLAIRIQERYIEKSDISGRDKQYKLKLNKEDDSFFSNGISRFDASLRTRFGATRRGRLPRSHGLIKKAYQILRQEVEAELNLKGTNEEKIKFITELASTVATKLQVIETVVGDEIDAYLIFETLNDRGLELSIADLFKNYLYSQAEKEGNLQEVQDQWEEIAKILENYSITNFLRHYWMSYSSFVREKGLYQELKGHLKEKGDIREFVGSLRREAENYYNLLEPSFSYWRNRQTADLLREWKLLNVRQVLPLLLSGCNVPRDGDFIELLKLCSALSFRYSIVCGWNPNRLEKIYSELAIALRKKKTNLDHIRGEFLKLDPNDKEFIEIFKGKEIKNSDLARYILAKIEGLKNNEIFDGEELEIRKDITLEHIMPKNPEKGTWKNFDEGLIFRIGNLTLLSRERNREGSNNTFEFKRKRTYSNSKLKITKSLCDFKDWDVEAIDKRQEDFAKSASRIWHL